MIRVFSILLVATMASFGQDSGKTFAGKEQPGAKLERFTLNNGRSYEGIWDPGRRQIHLVVKSNHVGNLPVSLNDIASRKVIGDGGTIKLYPDVDMAEQVVQRFVQNYKAAQVRAAAAVQNRDLLHATYKGKNLPTPEYNAVMARYKAAEDEITSSQKALNDTQEGFNKALDTYRQLGGKTAYTLP